MDDDAHTFHRLRPRLQTIAYRMLGSIAEAEDVVQDAWLRWHAATREEIDNTEAWLVSVATRLSIDRLRAAKTQREHYAGIWLPEPLLTDTPPTPEEISERADEVSYAYLLLLERLTPEARAAFLLHEIFDIGYEHIAETLGKTQAACRQLVSRAKAKLQGAQTSHAVPSEAHHQLMRSFAHVLQSGDFAAIHAFLAEDAILMGDGGGRVPSFPKPMVGGKRIAQLFFAACLRYKSALRIELIQLNGQWALLRFIEGELESAQVYESDGKRITRVYVQRNPSKLAHIAAMHTGR